VSCQESADAGFRATPRSTRFRLARHAHGGIVTKPTLGLFGEAGPEAYIPLDAHGGRFMERLGFGNRVEQTIIFEGNAAIGAAARSPDLMALDSLTINAVDKKALLAAQLPSVIRIKSGIDSVTSFGSTGRIMQPQSSPFRIRPRDVRPVTARSGGGPLAGSSTFPRTSFVPYVSLRPPIGGKPGVGW